MATRRNRIKGIANIPQRRKVEIGGNVETAQEGAPTAEVSSSAVHTLPVRESQPPAEFVKNVVEDNLVCPPSPTKLINRRIKAVPRLSQRRTSTTVYGSASESEDDTRKNFKRTRTESSCSVSEAQSLKSKEFSSVIQRKCKRTEQSRKMAEARRHFLHKFGNEKPDKQKLTMIDLIFYNPVTNPMSQKPKKLLPDSADSDPDEPVPPKKETEQKENVPVEAEEENGIPAPQIKIGPNGEIVVDEKSLIIENLETKRGREELQKSKLVDGDFDTGYGVFKREKRSKDWSKEETLRFYKALNTLGTDFTLMAELFIGRSRRELKMKFKKEERVNRALIDKALTQPIRFDMTELRKEVEEEKKRFEKEEVLKGMKVPEPPKKCISYWGKGKKKKVEKKVPKPAHPENIYKKIKKGIASVWNDSSDDNEDDEEPEYQLELKPTRSGRIPKPKQPYKDEDFSIVKKGENTVQDLSTLQPGSIMIVTCQTPTGQPTFKVFMVTPTQSKVPITLTPDMLNNLTQSPHSPILPIAKISSTDAENIDLTAVQPVTNNEVNNELETEMSCQQFSVETKDYRLQNETNELSAEAINNSNNAEPDSHLLQHEISGQQSVVELSDQLPTETASQLSTETNKLQPRVDLNNFQHEIGTEVH